MYQTNEQNPRSRVIYYTLYIIVFNNNIDRIAALERAVGFTPEQLSILTMETGKKNLTGALQVLSSKTAMMDPGKLDHIEGEHFKILMMDFKDGYSSEIIRPPWSSSAEVWGRSRE